MQQVVNWTEERRLFRTVTEATTLIAWATDESGHCFYLSPEWYKFTGTRAGEGLGFNWLTSVHPHDVMKVRRAFFESIDSRTAFGMAFRMLDRSGDYHLAWDVGLPKFSLDMTLEGFFGMTSVITPELIAQSAAPQEKIRPVSPGLTPREREVLTLISYGNTTDSIATMLQITSRTVDAHVANAGIKLGGVNRAHTVATAIRLNAI